MGHKTIVDEGEDMEESMDVGEGEDQVIGIALEAMSQVAIREINSDTVTKDSSNHSNNN